MAPGLHVESHGIAILGGFEHAGDNIHTTDPHAPTLRITGVACMGGVDVTTRHSGETARDAGNSSGKSNDGSPRAAHP